LNEEMAIVLLRCLKHGRSSVSQLECENGVSEIINENVDHMVQQVTSGIVAARLDVLAKEHQQAKESRKKIADRFS
jgi:hypothetical protein